MNKNKIEEIKNTIKSKQEELNKYCQEQFKIGTNDLFNENPKLESFSFRGCVPYFNDGEECVFGAYTDYPDINGEDFYDTNDKELEEIKGKVVDFLQAFDDDFYQTLFGDHFEVLIKKDKIEVSSWTDHD